MSSWSTKRQFEYGTFFILFLVVIIGVPGYYFLKQPASCFDGKQNGDERAVDCGGKCKRVCASDTLPPIVLWQRSAKVSTGFYNVLAYAENPNQGTVIDRVTYTFKLYDSENILITERLGQTFLFPKKITPIFEGALYSGSRTPARVTFDFTRPGEFVKTTMKQPEIAVSNSVYGDSDGFPRITASITNKSLLPVKKIDVVAVVFDKDGNAMAFSKTIIDTLQKNQTLPVAFTWREAFPSEISKIEIIPKPSLSQ